MKKVSALPKSVTFRIDNVVLNETTNDPLQTVVNQKTPDWVDKYMSHRVLKGLTPVKLTSSIIEVFALLRNTNATSNEESLKLK
jgi:hypothetical protein